MQVIDGYQLVEVHRSLDGEVYLVVMRALSGDLTIGFTTEPDRGPKGLLGHTHGDILAKTTGLSEDTAVRNYVDRILHDAAIIGVVRVGDEILNLWETEDPAESVRYKTDEETFEFRRWSGAIVSVNEG